MPDTGFLFLSLVSLVLAVVLFLHPQGLVRFSGALNRTLAILDERLIRYRYLVGLLAFAGSYAFFRLALLLPLLR